MDSKNIQEPKTKLLVKTITSFQVDANGWFLIADAGQEKLFLVDAGKRLVGTCELLQEGKKVDLDGMIEIFLDAACGTIVMLKNVRGKSAVGIFKLKCKGRKCDCLEDLAVGGKDGYLMVQAECRFWIQDAKQMIRPTAAMLYEGTQKPDEKLSNHPC